MTLRIFGLFLVLSVASVGAHAQTNPTVEQLRGSDLFHACQASVRIMDAPNGSGLSNDDYEHSEFCRGYFTAFSDLNSALGSICLGGATAGTSIRVYVTYMEKNPVYMDDNMIIGVIHALKETYPCPSAKK
jgi:hypothetical protein